MKLNLYCNRQAKNQLVDIIYISNFKHDGMHIFLCSGAHFSVHKKENQYKLWRERDLGSGDRGQGSGSGLRGQSEVQQKTNARPLDPLNP